MRLLERLRVRMAAGATGPFAHAGYPLTNSLDYRGDPGLFGPDSMTWPVIGSPVSIYGGLRSLLIQAAHPEVVAGVEDHSRYQEDPLGRLSRTGNYVIATSFGAIPEVERAVELVRRRHAPVVGESHRHRPYTADEPGLSAWVHNALTDSFLVGYRTFSGRKLNDEEADRFVREQAKVGALFDADPIPDTAEGLAHWIVSHKEIASAPAMADVVAFLRNPPLPAVTLLSYRFIFAAVSATIPPRLRTILGLRKIPGAILAGKIIARLLSWALGSSPNWQLACLRINAPVPEGVVFKQPLLIPENPRFS